MKKERLPYEPLTIAEKYARNDLGGRKRLKRGEGLTVHPEKQWPENWTVNQDSAFVFVPVSERAVWGRVTSRIDELARARGIELWLTVRDYPLHASIQSGLHPGDRASREKGYSRIMNDEEVRARAEEFKGVPVVFKYLLVNGDNITLNAMDIPESVIRYRDFFSKKLEAQGFRPADMSNIVHMTLARIKKLPEKDGEEMRRLFVDDLIKLRHQISREPLRLTVDHMFLGTNLMNKRREEV